MYLCEEYLQRHKIDVPYARHVERGAVFFRTQYDSSWRILSIEWKPQVVHPGEYLIKTFKPLHDGYQIKSLFEPTSKNLVVHWDEYDAFFVKWVAGLTLDLIATNVKSVHLAAWDMLLCCFDSLAQGEYRQQLCAAADVSKSADERFAALQDALAFVSRYLPPIHEAWTYEISAYLRDYCYWVPKLL